MTYIQTRFMVAATIQDGTPYAHGRMTGVCSVASDMGYSGSELSVRLQLLGEVLAAKRLLTK